MLQLRFVMKRVHLGLLCIIREVMLQLRFVIFSKTFDHADHVSVTSLTSNKKINKL